MRIILTVCIALCMVACSNTKKQAKTSASKTQTTTQETHNMKTTTSSEQAANVYGFSMKNIDGEETSLANYEGKVLLIVNVASKCGLTPQYEDLQAFYQKYQDKGVEILGFPANNFMGQEPGTNEEIKTFCTSKFNVTFPMFAKISVKGKDIHPLYTYLTETTGEKVGWNFHKYLINKEGKVIKSISPRTKVSDETVIQTIEELL